MNRAIVPVDRELLVPADREILVPADRELLALAHRELFPHLFPPKHSPCDITSVRIMRYSVPLWAASTLVVFATLVLLSYVTVLVLYISAAAIAGFLSDQLIKLAVNLAPRRLLPGLRERAVFITGCSSGFGLQLAKRLDALGVIVYAGLRKPHSTGALELKATCSKNLHIVVIDVTKDEDVKNASPSLTFPMFWAVVNNAGVSAIGDVELTPFSVFSHLMETNALGCVRVTKAFLPLLRESKGRVVCVGSISGLFAFPGLTHYAMSKHALTAFADGLRRELRKWSIGVHVVDPHMYQTAMTNEMSSIKKLKENWETCSEKTLTDYGPDFFKKYTEGGLMRHEDLGAKLYWLSLEVTGRSEFKYRPREREIYREPVERKSSRAFGRYHGRHLGRNTAGTLVVVSPGIVPGLQDISWYSMAGKRGSSLVQGESTQLPNPSARHKNVEPIDTALCTICTKISM
uniref:Ketoreductase domain-containing protein n=1 Tax=Timema shepardi TaxID=629360 RepID=A0A7R9G3S6_TIMSH|nr:unnamed protein product [Timema shepardi]